MAVFMLGVLACSLSSLSLHKLQSLRFHGLDTLWCAMFLLIFQVALEEELDLLHRNAQVDHTIKERPAGDRKVENNMKHSLCDHNMRHFTH